MANYKEPVTLLSQVVSGVIAVQSLALDMRRLQDAAFQVNCAAGLNATFQVLGSLDGVNYVDMQQVISPLTAGASNFIVNLPSVAVAFLKFQITPSSGSAAIAVWGAAKGI